MVIFLSAHTTSGGKILPTLRSDPFLSTLYTVTPICKVVLGLGWCTVPRVAMAKRRNPDLLLEEANAFIAAIWFWNKNNLNVLADKNDVTGITKRINGGSNGLAERKALVAKYQSEL